MCGPVSLGAGGEKEGPEGWEITDTNTQGGNITHQMRARGRPL